MTDKKISELTSITGANVVDTSDVLLIVDSNTSESKKITREELFKGIDGEVEVLSGAVVLNGNTISAVQVTIADDAVAELTFPNRYGGLLLVVCGAEGVFPQIGNFSGLVPVDFGDSPGVLTPLFAGTSFETNNSSALTGTTGTDGAVTVGTAGTSGTLYIENRSNSNNTFQITLL